MPTLRTKMLRRYFNQSVISKNWKKINSGPLAKAGATTRLIMRRSIRRAKKPSKVGKPPHAHRPKEYRGHDDFKAIFYVPAPWGTAVLVGHRGFGQKQTPMETQEFGQRVTIKRRRAKRKAYTTKQARAARRKFLAGEIQSKPIHTETISFKMPERPFAKPALEKAKKHLPGLWANSVSSSTVAQRA